MATPLRRIAAKAKVIVINAAPTSRVTELREKLAKASGGSIPALAGYSTNEVVKRYASKIRNRSTAIRAKCIECCNGGVAEVAACTVEKCALHPFRMGKDPFHSRSKSAEPGAEHDDDASEHDEPELPATEAQP